MYRYAQIAVWTLCACSSGPTGESAGVDMNPPATMSTSHVIDEFLDPRLRPDLDILFVIDNSPGMSPKQRALAANISKLIEVIEATGANYHIGITTSDVGTETAPGVPWGGGLSGACESFEGDDGMLQKIVCKDRTNGSADARNACTSLCPGNQYFPYDGSHYISKIDGISNVPKDLQLDPKSGKMVDRGPSTAFKCMALVGDGGCGIEGPLEGAKRALDGHRRENFGFLRKNSTLAVIYLTDEDDCSVQIDRRGENDPNTLDCPTGDQNASFKCYNPDYRCIATDVQCDQPMNVPGKKTNCKPRSNSRLEAVDKYFKFLSTLRPNPAKLFIGGIWALPPIDMPGGNLMVSKDGSGTATSSLNRATGTDAACTYAKDANLVGQAQHRLSRFARQFKDLAGNPNGIEVSICDIDRYEDALDQIGQRIARKIQASCLGGLPTLRSNGSPACLVGYVDESTPHASSDVRFPVCRPDCCKAWAESDQPSTKDPMIMNGCKGDVTEVCYCAVPSQKPGVCSGTAVAGIWRKDNALPPPGKVVNFKCAVSN